MTNLIVGEKIGKVEETDGEDLGKSNGVGLEPNYNSWDQNKNITIK